ncbi:hypothetical protein DY000_02022059 [Brassica cretica]|uniref:Nudix hydrolase domain-containing protein n=1 Tax=Brassica cretica TaxID=69181 RepID=A0ABQ7ECV9_BRACR|nr:hypothetical protein DY000_02022059 [Brassica cretica]
MDENKVEVWVSLPLGLSTSPILMRWSLLITGCSRDARNRSAIPITVPRSPFPCSTITTADLEDLYTVYGVDRAVVLDLASASETPETVRGGYCRAYLSFFQSFGLSFPIPELVLEILRSLLNKQSPGTFLVSPCPGRHVIEDAPYRDEKWREKFFVFKVDRASMGDFDSSRLPRNWAENIVHSGSSLMSDEIWGLIGALRRGGTNRPPPVIGSSNDEAEPSLLPCQGEVIATSSIQAQSLDRSPRQLIRRSLFRTPESVSRSRASDRRPLISIRDFDDEDGSGERRSSVSLSPGWEDEVVAASRKRRRSSKAALPRPSCSRRESTVRGLASEGDGPLFAAQDDLISLAGRMRSASSRLPSLASATEKEAYAKVAVVSSKVMEAFNEYGVAMEDRVEVSRNDKEIKNFGSEIKRLSAELETTKREGKRDAKKIEALTDDWRRTYQENATLAAQVVVQRDKIAALEEKWANKKKDTSAEIQLQEVVANIDLLNELKGGGLNVAAEHTRLNEMEKDCEGLVALAAVSDWSIFGLDLPLVSEDSVDQARGSSVPDGIVEMWGCLSLYKALPRLGFIVVLSIDYCFLLPKRHGSSRIRNRAGGVSAERIRSGDVNEALTEVLREETRLPPTGSEGRDRPPKKVKTTGADHRHSASGDTVVAKPFHWQFFHSKDCPITEDPDSVAHLVRHFKPAGCPLPSLRNMTEREAMEANNDFAATLERRLQDVPRSDELYEIKKVVRELKLGLKMAQDREGANAAQLAAAEKLGNRAASLEARLRVVSNERKSALEQVSFLVAKAESSANKFSDDLRRATYDAKKALADSYLGVLVSLKEKWEKK